MNTEIHNAFINAVLSDACYVDGLSDGLTGGDLSTKLGTALTPKLANYVGDNFRIITQYTNPNLLAGGLSVTVFEEKSTGQRYIAFRGTEPNDPRDLATDADVETGSGLAQAEVLDMVNWYKRATSPSGSETVQIKPSLLPLTYASFVGNGDGSLLVNGQRYSGISPPIQRDASPTTNGADPIRRRSCSSMQATNGNASPWKNCPQS